MAKDYYHNQIKKALEKDGWLVTHDPYEISVDEINYEIDFGAEGLIGAEREGEKIAVEGKSFIGKSNVNEFHRAVGQFNDYFVALEEIESDRTLYLAVPEDVWRNFFQKPIIQKSLKRIGARIIVYNPHLENIILWEK